MNNFRVIPTWPPNNCESLHDNCNDNCNDDNYYHDDYHHYDDKPEDFRILSTYACRESAIPTPPTPIEGSIIAMQYGIIDPETQIATEYFHYTQYPFAVDIVEPFYNCVSTVPGLECDGYEIKVPAGKWNININTKVSTWPPSPVTNFSMGVVIDDNHVQIGLLDIGISETVFNFSKTVDILNDTGIWIYAQCTQDFTENPTIAIGRSSPITITVAS